MQKISLSKNVISRCFIILFSVLFLISCIGILNSCQALKTIESEKDIHQQAVDKSFHWITMHQTSLEVDGPIPVLEEIIAFHVLWRYTKDAELKRIYADEFQKRVGLIASINDYKIHPNQYTSFLAIALFAEKMQIDALDFRKMIEEQIIPSPTLFSHNITDTIWNTAYLDRLGYNPPLNLNHLMEQSNLQQEAYQKLLYRDICRPSDPDLIDKMALTIYHMTHEIFALTNFGEYPKPPVIENHESFFSEFFEKAIQWTISINNVDLLGEIIMCVKMLDLKDVPSIQKGIDFILSKQEDNGTFGITNPTLPNIYRHGILVAMMTLSIYHQ